ncbi:G-type lectin S-receptor-like serine/threonine-protein kinase isoform X1 [Tanacetum coccineum]
MTTSSSAVDTLFSNQTLKDGDTIVSAGEIFQLGFFSPVNSSLRYVGIWYKKISTGTVVWVANREVPVVDLTGMLKLSDKGILQLLSVSNTLVWSSLSSNLSRNINPVAQLLDSGNFVIRDDISGSFIWQSFDHPGDTLLPGMKLGVDLVTGIYRNLTSWNTSYDPSSGIYTVWMDRNGNPQLYESIAVEVLSRFGFWNGMGFTGMRGLGQSSFYKFEFVLNSKEIYYAYKLVSNSFLTRITLGPSGRFHQLIWCDQTQTWVYSMVDFSDNCDSYGICGVYGSCNINNSPACNCFEGFEPVQPKDWSVADWSSGCQRSISVTKENEHYFKRFTNLKLPDTRDSWFNSTMSLQECENACISNFSCTAYANSDIRGGGSGCLLWFSDLIDIREALLDDVSGQEMYMKMAYPNLTQDKKEKGEKKKKKSHLKFTLSIVFGVVLLSFALILYAWRRNKSSHYKAYIHKAGKQDMELPLFSLNKIVKATGNFSPNNKLGQGGFGAVYKGVLEEGGEIAVKRLSKTSRQGLVEFQNEVICIAKLQHRNLVKLLGYCLQGEEMMLIYEYMPNKSLDFFLFDKTSSLLLNWRQRYHIINGIARGLLYLHQDSRLRIIHRDLKASNILLDSNMNPKISDFGLARMFKEYETEANTNKVVGTLGYISPEYAANGLFSVKSDVFSFGVLVLEIVSGKKNREFTHQDHHDNLLGHAWRLYKEDKPLDELVV